jgi:hypothetical protein
MEVRPAKLTVPELSVATSERGLLDPQTGCNYKFSKGLAHHRADIAPIELTTLRIGSCAFRANASTQLDFRVGAGISFRF